MTTALKTTRNVAGAGAIACCVAFLPAWEGMDKVARKDDIGTGHPVTYCYGQTDEFGKVKVGTRFTKQECDAKLAESLPRYLVPLQACVKVPLPDKTMASLLDAAYNAGSAAVCRSPMVAKMNAGNIRAGCEAFYYKDKNGNEHGWYIRSDGKVRKGLVARRGGLPNDSRKSERQLCLEGLTEKRDALPAPAPRPYVATPKCPSWWRKCA